MTTATDDRAVPDELTFWELLERLAAAWGARLVKWRRGKRAA